MKQIIILFLVLLTAAFGAHAYDFEVDGIYYDIYEDEAIVSYDESVGPLYSGTVVIPETVTYDGTTYTVTGIKDGAFMGCTELTNVTIPNSVIIIGKYAFYSCISLTSITIPNSVISIGNEVFAYCSKLNSVTIGYSVQSIGSCAFMYCHALEKISVNDGNPYYDSRDNCNAIIETATNTLVVGCQGTVIPNSVTTIGDNAFTCCYTYGLSTVTNVTIPSSVTAIGGGAFTGCDNLISITCLAITPPTMARWVFENDTYSNVTLIVPEGCKSIYESAFGWQDFVSIQEYPDTIVGSDTIYYNITGYDEVEVTYKGEYEDYNCYRGHITIPATVIIDGKTYTVTAIGERAFNDCGYLASVTIPNTVKTIGECSFYHCINLANLNIPNSVTTIKSQAFYYSGLKSITIPNSVTSIGQGAFEECSGLKSVTLPNSIVIIDNNTFSECYNLTSITIPNSVTCIRSGAFQGSGLTSVTVPEGVTEIGSRAFAYCPLTSVYLPRSLTGLVGSSGFEGCDKLMNVTCLATTPPWMVAKNIFDDKTYSDGTLYVPERSMSAYRNASYWENFVNIEGITVIEPGDIDGDGVLNVNDVTGLIDIILEGTANIEDNPAADVNGDGIINVADVTTLIDMLLAAS